MVLLEREHELELLESALARINDAGGQVILIRGEAGIGKTALVSEFTRRHVDDTHVLIGYCDDLLTPQPYGPFWDISRQQPTLKQALESHDSSAVLEIALGLLFGSLRPTTMVIEDTHWADEATTDAIRYLGRRIGTSNGLLILTYRDGEIDYDHPLRKVIGDLPPQHVLRLQLGGLSSDAIERLLVSSAADATQVLTATRGNPFLITEMAADHEGGVPSSVQDSVMARVASLSSDAADLLKLLSVIPEPVPRSELSLLAANHDAPIAECERRGLLEVDVHLVKFRHELTRQAVEASLTETERIANNRILLETLPPETDPARLVHHAREANDTEQLVQLVPPAAKAASAVGSHREAVDHYRQLKDHIDELDPGVKGSVLDDWAREELLSDNVEEAIRLSHLAILHYRQVSDHSNHSGALARAAHYAEAAGQRERAEELAQEAITVLGPAASGPDLARALEVNAYLKMMEGNVSEVPGLVERTLEAGGSEIDEQIYIRTLNHLGVVRNIATYPAGRSDLDEASHRARQAGQWYEDARALVNHAWAAIEFRDLSTASEYLKRAIASAERHQLLALAAYGEGLYARVLDLTGDWVKAEDVATSHLDSHQLGQMVVLPVLGGIAARKGRITARDQLHKAWDMAVRSKENQRLAPAAIALAEYAWISGDGGAPLDDFKRVMYEDLDKGFRWSPGAIAFWLWKLGELSDIPEGLAEPYRLVMEGRPVNAAAIWEARGIPYEQALAFMHGETSSQMRALETLDSLGATAVAAKLRKSLRDQGVSTSRGKGRATRQHPAGLTARQAEVLALLGEGLTNAEIADRLFVSPRTIEHHVSATLAKLDSKTREEAVARARSAGLLRDQT